MRCQRRPSAGRALEARRWFRRPFAPAPRGGRRRIGLITWHRRLGTLGLAAALALASVATADEAAEPERIVVRAPRVARPFEPSLDLVAFGSTIDTQDAPRWVHTLADVLDDAVGVRVRRFGGLGEFSTVSVRGFSPGQVQVYLDGVPISRADDETVDLADLPLDAIERVEVYRGQTSLDFAQSGPGGVVNVVPRRPTGEPLLAASVGFGSFGTRKVTLAAGGAAGGWEMLAFGQYLGGDGDFRFDTDLGTPEQPADDRRLTRRNADFDGGSVTTRLRRDVSDRFHLLITTDTFAKEHGVAGRDPVQSSGARREVVRQLGSLDGVLAFDAGRPVDVRATTHVVYRRERFHVPAGDPAFPVRDNRTESFAVGGQVVTRVLLADWLVPRTLAAVGWERFAGEDRVPVPPLREAGDAPRRTRLRTTLGGEVEIAPWGERVVVVPAVRWEHFRDAFPGDPRVPPALSVATTTTRDVVAPRLGVRVEPAAGVAVLGNVGRYERVPNLRELFGVSGTVVGDPGLVPEQARSWDAGMRLRPPTPWRLRDVWLEYAYFESRIDDVIILLPSSVNVFRPFNVAAALIRGHEVSGAIAADRVGLTANYTYQEARDLGEDTAFFTDNLLPGRPLHEVFARVDVGWDAPGWLPAVRGGSVFYDFNFVADTFLDRANLDRIDARLLHGLGAEVSLPRGVRLGVEVRNLTDDQTRDVADFPLPGRSAFVTVSYGFGGAGER